MPIGCARITEREAGKGNERSSPLHADSPQFNFLVQVPRPTGDVHHAPDVSRDQPIRCLTPPRAPGQKRVGTERLASANNFFGGGTTSASAKLSVEGENGLWT